jgi:predicted metal-binding protein
MEVWQRVSTLTCFEDYTFTKAPVPEYDEDSYNLAFERCKENKCGTFGTNWGCNPGAKMDVAAFYKEYDYVVIMSRRFEVDTKDTEYLDTIMDDVQRNFRRMILQLRDNNVDCVGFLDGPCRYCGECAYPDPCRFPDMKIVSVSTLGINLREYFKSFGQEFKFEEGSVTFYGFIFVRSNEHSAQND